MRSSYWLLSTALRIVTAPMTHVLFRDFYIADQVRASRRIAVSKWSVAVAQLASLAISIMDFEFFVCYFTTDWQEGTGVCLGCGGGGGGVGRYLTSLSSSPTTASTRGCDHSSPCCRFDRRRRRRRWPHRWRSTGAVAVSAGMTAAAAAAACLGKDVFHLALNVVKNRLIRHLPPRRRSVGRSVDRSVGRLADRSVGRSIDRLVDRSVGWLWLLIVVIAGVIFAAAATCS